MDSTNTMIDRVADPIDKSVFRKVLVRCSQAFEDNKKIPYALNALRIVEEQYCTKWIKNCKYDHIILRFRRFKRVFKSI